MKGCSHQTTLVPRPSERVQQDQRSLPFFGADGVMLLQPTGICRKRSELQASGSRCRRISIESTVLVGGTVQTTVVSTRYFITAVGSKFRAKTQPVFVSTAAIFSWTRSFHDCCRHLYGSSHTSTCRDRAREGETTLEEQRWGETMTLGRWGCACALAPVRGGTKPGWNLLATLRDRQRLHRAGPTT